MSNTMSEVVFRHQEKWIESSKGGRAERLYKGHKNKVDLGLCI